MNDRDEGFDLNSESEEEEKNEVERPSIRRKKSGMRMVQEHLSENTEPYSTSDPTAENHDDNATHVRLLEKEITRLKRYIRDIKSVSDIKST